MNKSVFAVGMNVMDKWLPKNSSLFERMKRYPAILYTLYKLRSRQIYPSQFKKSALEIYSKYNIALASGDKFTIANCCCIPYAAYLQPEVKKIGTIGIGTWAMKDAKIKILNMCCAQFGKKNDFVVQITTEINSKQSLVFNKDGNILGDATLQPIKEYVVFENMITREDCQWKIAGKIE